MSEKHTPLPLLLADSLSAGITTGHDWPNTDDELLRLQSASELRRLQVQRDELLAVLQELEESSAYWSEYDVPIGIVERIRAAITKATGQKGENL